MDLVLDLLANVSRWSRSHLSEIALALIGCVLVLFGADFKGWVERGLSQFNNYSLAPVLLVVLVLIGVVADRR